MGEFSSEIVFCGEAEASLDFLITQGRRFTLSPGYFIPALFVGGFFRFGCFGRFRGSGFWYFWGRFSAFWGQALTRCSGCL